MPTAQKKLRERPIALRKSVRDEMAKSGTVKDPEINRWVYLGPMSWAVDPVIYHEREPQPIEPWPMVWQPQTVKYWCVWLRRQRLAIMGRRNDRYGRKPDPRYMQFLVGQSERGTIYWAVVPVNGKMFYEREL